MPGRRAPKRGQRRKKLTGRVAGGARPRGAFRHNQSLSIDRQIGVPDKHRIRMRYNEYIALAPGNPTPGLIAGYEYRCDSLYDPNLTGTGHQPMGFKQMVQNYYVYALVIGCKMTVQFIPHSTSTSIPIACGIFSYDKSQTTLSIQGYTKWPQFRESGETVKFIGTDKPSVAVSCNYSMHKQAGVDPRASPDYWNTQGAGPIIGTNWVFYIWAQAQDQASVTAVVGCNVQIDYIVEFFTRIPITGS